MYRIGEYVIGSQGGVCRIENLRQWDKEGGQKEKWYYTLQPVFDQRGKRFMPMERMEVCVRYLTEKKELERLLEDGKKAKPLIVKNEKLREEVYKDAMRKYSCEEWIRMIRTMEGRRLKRRCQGKLITALDGRYLRLAQRYLAEESAVVFQITLNEAMELLNCVLMEENIE